MTSLSRRVFLAVAAASLGVGSGCGDMGAMTYFLMPEQRLEAKLKHLPSNDEKKPEPRVAILAWTGLETRSEFIHVDRELSILIARQLHELCQEGKEKLGFVPQLKVEEFKNKNVTTWRGMKLDDVGRSLGADYVIYLEINSLSLYEPRSSNTVLRGRADITVQLVDVHEPDESPITETFSCLYPSDARGGIPVDLDTQPHQFRQKFLTHIARQLARYFSRYPRSERYQVD